MGDPEEATAPPTSLRSIQTSEADLPIEGSQRQLVLETPQPSSTKRRLIPGALLLIAAMLAVIIGLSVGLSNSNSDDLNSNIGGSSPGAAPSASFPGAFPSASCPAVPAGGCSVCGPNSCVSNPSAIFSFPSQPLAPCGELQEAGYSGLVPLEYCPMLPPLVQETCSCVTTAAVMESRQVDAEAWILSQEYSSINALNDPGSPQSKAAKFMVDSIGIEVPTETTNPFSSFQWMERYALAVFYYALNGDNWLYRESFLARTLPSCQWFSTVLTSGGTRAVGASCTDASDRVNTLQFFANNLDGSLPSELGLLTDLEVLVLWSEEKLVGLLPDMLKNLRQLRVIETQSSNLSGSIPDWIGQWSSIEFMSFSANLFDGPLPASLSSLTALLLFAVDSNVMTGDLSALAGSTSLTSLYLEDNYFLDTLDNTFLQNLEKLRVLDISDNNLAGQVPVHLMGLTTLETMDINGNDLTQFPDSIPVNGTIDFLAAYDNPITGLFPSNTIRNLEALDHLDLTSTEFTGDMPTVLGDMRKLSYLFLADTSFNAGPIPDEYQRLTNLVDLSLKHSGRTGALPTWLKDLDKVVLLDLDSNEFNGTIPTEIGNMVGLQFLLLNRNSLEGDVPTELGFVTTLQYMFLEQNPGLTGNLDPVCEELTRLKFGGADCGGDNPQIVCECCICCDPANSTGCASSGYDLFAQYDPHWLSGYDRQGRYSFLHYNITDDDKEGDGNRRAIVRQI